MENLLQTLHKTTRKNIIVLFAALYFVVSTIFIFFNAWEKCDQSATRCEMRIAEYHLHDSMWHMALAKTAFSSWPPSNPVFAGEELKGYNFLFDILLFSADKLLGVSPLHGYFHLFPILTALLYIYSVLYFVNNFGFSERQKIFVALFLFLGNSFAFLMTIFSQGTLTGSSVRGFPLVLSLQPSTMFYNHQYALSLPIILFAFVYVKKAQSSLRKYIFLGIIVSILTLLKAYAGVSFLLLLMIHTLLSTSKRNLLKPLFYGFLLSAFFVATTVFMGGGGGRTFTFDAFAFIRSLIDDPSHFYRNDLALARVTLESSGKFSPRLVIMYSIFVLLWYVVNFGARLIFVFAYKKIFNKDEKRFYSALFLSIATLSLLPLFLLQKGDWWNTIQFMYYAVFFSSIPAGIVLEGVSGFKKYIVFLVISTTLFIPFADQVRHSLYSTNVILPADFISSTKFLSSLPDGGVSVFGEPTQDSMIAAFSGKKLMIGDIPVLINTFVDYKSREEEMKNYRYVKSADYIFINKQKDEGWQILKKSKKKLYENYTYLILEN